MHTPSIYNYIFGGHHYGESRGRKSGMWNEFSIRFCTFTIRKENTLQNVLLIIFLTLLKLLQANYHRAKTCIVIGSNFQHKVWTNIHGNKIQYDDYREGVDLFIVNVSKRNIHYFYTITCNL